MASWTMITRRPTALVTWAAALAALGGCQQSTRDAWQIVCDAPRCCSGATSEAERALGVAERIEARVTNPDVRQVMRALGDANPDTAGEILRERVREAGIDPATCEILAARSPLSR